MNTTHHGNGWGKSLRHFANRLRLALAYRRRTAEVEGFPTHLKIELTNFCNLRCPMCPLPKMQREVGFMEVGLFKKIIDETADYLEFAYLHLLGESLFHPHIFELIAYGKDKGVGLGLSTNGTILTEDKAINLLNSGLNFLVISFDGATKATYERMRLNANFEKTLAKVQRFFALKRQRHSPVSAVVQMVYSDETEQEVQTFVDMWPESVMVKKMNNWAGQMTELEQLNPHTFRNGQVPAKPCALLWNELSIQWDGTVVPCGNVYEKVNVLGNAHKESILEIWNGPVLKQFRECHSKNLVQDIPICRTCSRHKLRYLSYIFNDQLRQRKIRYRGRTAQIKSGLS